jgi:hypothetical protein
LLHVCCIKHLLAKKSSCQKIIDYIQRHENFKYINFSDNKNDVSNNFSVFRPSFILWIVSITSEVSRFKAFLMTFNRHILQWNTWTKPKNHRKHQNIHAKEHVKMGNKGTCLYLCGIGNKWKISKGREEHRPRLTRSSKFHIDNTMSKVIFRQVLIDEFAVQDEFPVSNINLTNILQTQGRRKHCKIRGAQQLREGLFN